MQVLTTTPVRVSAAPRWSDVLLPSLADFFFATLLAWLFLGGGGKSLLSDGDTGWHIRTGDYILQHHAVPRVDIFTFRRASAPSFAWEWLSEVLFSQVHQAWGVKGISLLAGVVLCAMAAVLFSHMLWSGGNLFLALGAASLATGAAFVHFLARPHVFTFLLLAVSLWLLARDRRRPDGVIWLLAPISVIWVNLHGGFLALIVCLGLTAAGYGLEWLFGGGTESRISLQRYSILAGVCSL